MLRGIFPALVLTLAVAASLAAPPVSVYYYPWYAGANWNQNNFLRGKTRMDIPPLIGTYDNVTNKVSVKQHIEWSTNFGVDNWIASWWGPASYHSNAIRNNVMPHLVGTKVTFCLFYETTAFYEGKWTFGPAEVQLFYDHIKFMHENFFTHPNYWKVGGKPVVVVYLSRQMQGSYPEALARVRQDFNVYLIGDDFHFGGPDVNRHKNWDAITIYNSHGIRTYDGYPQNTGFIEGARQNFRRHKTAVAASGVKLMSNTIPGYNDRAVRLTANNYPIPRRMHPDSVEGSTFDHMLKMALEEGDTSLGTAICSWNEWWEDSQIEPTVVSAPTDKDGTTAMDYSKGYKYEGYGATLLRILLARAGRNADIAPSLSLTAPAAQNDWTRGSARTLAWTHQGILYYVNLEYWNGTSWIRIATQVENTGTRAWTVASDAALPVQVRVTSVEGVTVSGNVTAGVMPGGARTVAPRVRAVGGRLHLENLGGFDRLEAFDGAGRRVMSWSIPESVGRAGAGLAVEAPGPGIYRLRFTGSAGSSVRTLAIAR